MFKNMLWAYINDRYENDGVLPDADEIYEKFKLEFDNGAPTEWIDTAVYNFTRHHVLTGIEIQYEGEIYKQNTVSL